MPENSKGPLLVVAPHPDDETLGAGGAMLRARAEGREVHWLIITRMHADDGWPEDKMERRKDEIIAVANAYDLTATHQLDFKAAQLDTVPLGDLVGAIGQVIKSVEPTEVLIPHRGDAHSDHACVHDATAACAKWFRYPSVKVLLVYETLSETDAGLQDLAPFNPNVFIDISGFIEKKLEITTLFGDEIQDFPFPRSLEAIKALATLRGAASGTRAAEAFMLLRARV